MNNRVFHNFVQFKNLLFIQISGVYHHNFEWSLFRLRLIKRKKKNERLKEETIKEEEDRNFNFSKCT